MLGTCPLVVIHEGDVTSGSVVLVVRTTRSGSPCFVGGITTTTTSAGGRPFVSLALLGLPCSALPRRVRGLPTDRSRHAPQATPLGVREAHKS